MLVKIVVPVFRCKEDENIFFSRLYDLSGFDQIISKGGQLYLTLVDVDEEETEAEIQEICAVWGAVFEVLKY